MENILLEQRYILALSFIKNLGDSRINSLIETFGSAKSAWDNCNSILNNPKGIGAKIINEIGKAEYLDLADKEIEFCKKYNITIITYYQDNYPSLLKQCPDAPIILYTKGNINFEASLNIAIVGTRKITNYGKQFINEIIEGLQNQNVNIISGLAYGCDIYAHQKALDFGLPTFAVLAHHLNHIYPSQHKKIAEQMLENGGWISEQNSTKGVQPSYFLQRNRIIAGLSKATIVVESASHGGSLVTAKIANDYNRDVFALPGRNTDIMSQGCNHLIKTNQAYLVENINDLIYHLNLDKTAKPKQLDLFYELTPEQEEIVNYLNQNGKTHIDNLAVALNKFSYQLMPVLLDLELNQIVIPLPGKYFDLST